MSNQKLAKKPSLEFYNLVRQSVDILSNDNNQDQTQESLWIKMGNELEIQGFPQNQISKIIHDSIEDKLYEKKFKGLRIPRDQYRWHSGHFYEVTKKHHWSNPFYSHNNNDAPVQEREDSSKSNQYESENDSYLKRIDGSIDILKLFKTKLKTEPFISKLDSKTIQNLEEHFILWDQIVESSRQSFDKRNKVPTNTQHILAYCLSTSSSINYGAGLYLSKLKKLGDFTAKQSGKITKGVTKGILKLFDPKTRDEAIFAGFYGLSCIHCKSWRVILKQDDGNNDYCKCYSCDGTFHKKTVSKCRYCQFPFYDDVLQDVIHYGNQCPNCNAEVNLPESMISIHSNKSE